MAGVTLIFSCGHWPARCLLGAGFNSSFLWVPVFTGIFFKYDLSPVKVHIVEGYNPFLGLLVKLCGIVGGMFATSGECFKLIIQDQD